MGKEHMKNKCQCMDEYNAPEGLICGDPECWQTKKAEENLKEIVKTIEEKQ